MVLSAADKVANADFRFHRRRPFGCLWPRCLFLVRSNGVGAIDAGLVVGAEVRGRNLNWWGVRVYKEEMRCEFTI
jgi:hypothetical protein